jgi:methionine-rich copper-binding protein CopC
MKRRRGLALIGTVAVAATAPFGPTAACAHAFPNAEQPLVGSTVTKPPQQVAITYDAPIESLFAQLDVVNGSGEQETNGTPAVGPDHRTLSIALKPLQPGDYTVKWSVVAEDGHRTEGSYDFTVAGDGS